MSYINKNILVLPLIYDSQCKIETIRLKLMKNASFDVTNCRPVNSQKTSKILITLQNFFYFSGRYVRKAKFSDGGDQLCALGLSAAIKNHKDTFQIHKK